jgi:methyl-accepting chemotaxis protein
VVELVHDAQVEPGRPGVPIGFRVTAGVGGLLLLTVLIAGLGVAAMMRLSGSAERLDHHYVPYATALSTAQLDAKGMANDERGFLLTGNPAFVAELNGRATEVRAAFASATQAAVSADQRAAVASASAEFERWTAGVTSEIAMYRAGQAQAARTWSLGIGREMRKRYEAALNAATTRTDRAIVSHSAAFSSLASQSVAILLIALIVALAIGIALSVWLIRTILRPVHSLVALLSGFDELRMV